MTRYFKMFVALVVALMATVGGLQDAEAQERDADWIAAASGYYYEPVFGFGLGDSLEAAESAALSRCTADNCEIVRGRNGRGGFAERHVCQALFDTHYVISASTREGAVNAANEYCEEQKRNGCKTWEIGIVVECAGLARIKEPAVEYVAAATKFYDSEWRAFAFGDSAEAAESAALSLCHATDADANCKALSSRSCIAVAQAPGMARAQAGIGRTEDEAVYAAVQQCRYWDEHFSGGDGAECYVPRGAEENPGVVCVAREGSEGSGDWAALAVGFSGQGPNPVVWAFGSGEGKTAAESDAVARCAPLTHNGECKIFSGTMPGCRAIAVTDTSETWYYASEGARTREEAEKRAIERCESVVVNWGAGTCRIMASPGGEPGSACFGVE